MRKESQNCHGSATEPEPVPIAAASVLLFQGAKVLLVRRAAGDMAGLWSAPGGHIEAGESAIMAAARELREETGLAAETLVPLATHLAAIKAAHDAPGRIYQIAVFTGISQPRCKPHAAGDAAEARFFDPLALSTLEKTPGLDELIAAARVIAARL